MPFLREEHLQVGRLQNRMTLFNTPSPPRQKSHRVCTAGHWCHCVSQLQGSASLSQLWEVLLG